VTTAAVVVVALPALRYPADGFPLSSYPMFGSDRDREVVIPTAVGIGDAGEVMRLDPRAIADTDESVQAAETVRLAMEIGDEARLCEEIAARLDAGSDVRTVEVRSETYDVVSYFDGVTAPLAVGIHAACEVSE
jgi:hypothetical protein